MQQSPTVTEEFRRRRREPQKLGARRASSPGNMPARTSDISSRMDSNSHPRRRCSFDLHGGTSAAKEASNEPSKPSMNVDYLGEESSTADPAWSREAVEAQRSPSRRKRDALMRKGSPHRRDSLAFAFRGHRSDKDDETSGLSAQLAELKSIHGLGFKMHRDQKPLECERPVGNGRRDFVQTRDACFGYISWRKPDPSEAPQPQARYACIDSDTNVNDVFSLLNDSWKLKRPSVLISVTGSAQDIDLEPRLATEFEKGLSMAASCTEGWVVTGGTDTGVMALVGKALQQRKLEHMYDGQQLPSPLRDVPPLIGIVPFGAVMHNDKLYACITALRVCLNSPTDRCCALPVCPAGTSRRYAKLWTTSTSIQTSPKIRPRNYSDPYQSLAARSISVTLRFNLPS